MEKNSLLLDCHCIDWCSLKWKIHLWNFQSFLLLCHWVRGQWAADSRDHPSFCRGFSMSLKFYPNRLNSFLLSRCNHPWILKKVAFRANNSLSVAWPLLWERLWTWHHLQLREGDQMSPNYFILIQAWYINENSTDWPRMVSVREGCKKRPF